jgi:hypothetical protein
MQQKVIAQKVGKSPTRETTEEGSSRPDLGRDLSILSITQYAQSEVLAGSEHSEHYSVCLVRDLSISSTAQYTQSRT